MCQSGNLSRTKCVYFLSFSFPFLEFVDIVICRFLFPLYRCLFNIAIVHHCIVKSSKIHSNTNLKLAYNNLHHSPKQQLDDHLFNSNSSKKKKKFISGSGSALPNTGEQEKLSANMFSGRSGPQVHCSIHVN